MEISTAFALVAFADQCLKYGTKLVKRCKTYYRAEEEAKEFLISIEFNWMKTEAQISFLKSIAESLDERYLSMQSHILSQLEGKLKTATLTLDQLIEKKKRGETHEAKDLAVRIKSLALMSPAKKTKYAFKKESLQAIVDDLERWQARFDPCWMLIMRMESPAIENQLRREANKPDLDRSPFIMTANELRNAAKARLESYLDTQGAVWLDFELIDQPLTVILLSPVSTAHIKESGDQVLIDTIHCNPIADVARTSEDIYNLARILATVDLTIFGLLKCRGVIRGSEIVNDPYGRPAVLPKFSFVFNICPELQNPRSLRSLLLEAAAYPLNERFDLARQLTYCILYIHTARFVHKNIRPETIVVFQNQKSDIGAPFLVGFEKFRHADGQTYRAGDGKWEQNLYRHPTRQGVLPEEEYKMQHDIYSVGVVLLEIGLWASLVTYPNSAASTTAEEPTTAVPSDLLALLPPSEEKDPRRRAFRNKDMLEELADRELPRRIGRKYTDVVLLCLRCLAEGDGTDLLGPEHGKGQGVLDGEGVEIGVRFIENILEKVQEICI